MKSRAKVSSGDSRRASAQAAAAATTQKKVHNKKVQARVTTVAKAKQQAHQNYCIGNISRAYQKQQQPKKRYKKKAKTRVTTRGKVKQHQQDQKKQKR